MRISPLILSAAVALGLAACQPAQQADPAAADPAVGTPASVEAPAADAGGSLAPAAPAAGTEAPPAFRATGNEPGWLAQVSDGPNPVLRVETGYGEQKYEIASPTQGKDGWSGKAADGTEIKLSYQRTVCQDNMSGQEFGATVMLTVGARQYHGCGDFAGAPAQTTRP